MMIDSNSKIIFLIYRNSSRSRKVFKTFQNILLYSFVVSFLAVLQYHPSLAQTASITSLSNIAICYDATKNGEYFYESDGNWKKYVFEAKRRGLSLNDCRLAMGLEKITEVNVSLSNEERDFCAKYLTKDKKNFTEYARYLSVLSAYIQKHNLTPDKCRLAIMPEPDKPEITNQNINSQSAMTQTGADASKPNTESALTNASDVISLDNRKLCLGALRKSLDEFDMESPFLSELLKRKISLADCRRTIGKSNDIAKLQSQNDQPSNLNKLTPIDNSKSNSLVVELSNKFSSLNTVSLCLELNNQANLNSETIKQLKNEISTRHLNQSDCDLLLASQNAKQTKTIESATENPNSSSSKLQLQKQVNLPALKRVALVIGNNNYKSVPRLDNAERDAKLVADALKDVGFTKVTYLANLDRNSMYDALRAFSDDAEMADWAMVYYSGHGIEVGGNNYLIPIDSVLKRDRDVDVETIELSKILSVLDGAKQIKLVVLDACRDNPFAKSMARSIASRSIGRGLAEIEPEAGSLVVYSAKHGQVAFDGDTGTNGPFAKALVNRIKTPNLDIRRMFDLVRDDVLELTGNKQQPFVYGSVSGKQDFMFNAK